MGRSKFEGIGTATRPYCILYKTLCEACHNNDTRGSANLGYIAETLSPLTNAAGAGFLSDKISEKSRSWYPAKLHIVEKRPRRPGGTVPDRVGFGSR